MTLIWCILLAGALLFRFFNTTANWCLYPAAGCLAGLLLSLLDVNFLIEIACALLISLTAWLIMKRSYPAQEPEENPGEALIGQMGMTLTAIPGKGQGTVTVLKTKWKAAGWHGEAIGEGMLVRVKDAKRNVLFVAAAEPARQDRDESRKKSRH